VKAQTKGFPFSEFLEDLQRSLFLKNIEFFERSSEFTQNLRIPSEQTSKKLSLGELSNNRFLKFQNENLDLMIKLRLQIEKCDSSEFQSIINNPGRRKRGLKLDDSRVKFFIPTKLKTETNIAFPEDLANIFFFRCNKTLYKRHFLKREFIDWGKEKDDCIVFWGNESLKRKKMNFQRPFYTKLEDFL